MILSLIGPSKMLQSPDSARDQSHQISEEKFAVSEKLRNKSKELARKSSGEAEWTEALYTAIDELKPSGLEIARNRALHEDFLLACKRPLASSVTRMSHLLAFDQRVE
ncbi:nucleoporin Nsp1 [Aspergillus luchuensis]|uniref:Nucleoporin Nsp1 n=1 Tax=Aspergillus kawachii TaxID=1069201 RepID=A0A146F5X5_ASPKA|nr:nucleoporin Nsp1 [Aspergillus luchuensis]